jgi:hypothetical protein
MVASLLWGLTVSRTARRAAALRSPEAILDTVSPQSSNSTKGFRSGRAPLFSRAINATLVSSIASNEANVGDLILLKKYQVFVSSTFRDLVDERQDAIRNILDLKHIPAGMELFPATDVEQLTYIKKVIDECDYYILIMGGRYGSMDAAGISYTEREYDYAVSTSKVVLAFVHNDPAAIPVGKSDVSEPVVAALNAFREKVMGGRLVKGWTTRANLEPLVLKALIHVFNDMPQVGWIRGDAAATQPLIEQSNSLLQENSSLKSELNQLKLAETPRIEGLASLEDEFDIRYEYSWHDTRGSTKYTDTKATLSWRQIFLALGSLLDVSRTDSIIKDAVREAIKESGSGRDLARLNNIDRVKIKLQFEALGLIDVRVSKTTQGGTAEFLALTKRGRSVLIEGMVERKSEN